MDRAQWGNLGEWAAVLAAVAIAILSMVRAGRAAEKADAAQSRATQALELAAAAQNRLAALAEAEAARYDVPWVIEPAGGSSYLLGNEGDEVAYDVTIEDPHIIHSPVRQARVGPREAVRFVATTGLDQANVVVTVSWYREPNQRGDRHEWRYPLS